MFEKIATAIPGCFELLPRKMEDARGSFVKTYHCSLFRSLGLETEWREEYYSVSHRGVLRGLHFQLPPHDHAKLVYCPAGEMLDAVVDLRAGSPHFGRHVILTLSGARANMVYIPRGCAHGFYTLSYTATMMYKVGTEYAPQADYGVRWDSAGIPWPAAQPVISERDAGFCRLEDFSSPFVYEEEPPCGERL